MARITYELPRKEWKDDVDLWPEVTYVDLPLSQDLDKGKLEEQSMEGQVQAIPQEHMEHSQIHLSQRCVPECLHPDKPLRYHRPQNQPQQPPPAAIAQGFSSRQNVS